MEKFHTVIKNTQAKMKNGKVEGMGSEEQSQKEKSKGELVPLSELFKPKPGSWVCSSCAVENKENAMSCVCCTTPKPGTKAESTGRFGNKPRSGNIIIFNIFYLNDKCLRLQEMLLLSRKVWEKESFFLRPP